MKPLVAMGCAIIFAVVFAGALNFLGFHGYYAGYAVVAFLITAYHAFLASL